MPKAAAFVLAEGNTMDGAHRALTCELGCVAGETEAVAHVYYDTFDGRLFGAGLVLEHERPDDLPGRGTVAPAAARPGRSWLRLRALGEPGPIAEVALEDVPVDPRRLPDGRLRDRVMEVGEGRALLPVVADRALVRSYRVLGPEAKTTVRLVACAAHAEIPDGPLALPSASTSGGRARRRRGLEETLTVVPVRGYGAEHERVVARLAGIVGERPASDPLVRAARAVGVPLGVDPSDHRVPLVAAAPAAAAAAALLERLWAVMAANEAGVRAQLDVEFLHDFRVAVRRARTIVRAARGVLPDATRDRLAAELKWLGDTTTPVRDLDVYLEGGPPEPELEPLWAVLDADRANAHAALVAALDSERYARLGALVSSVTRPREAPAAAPSTAQWAHHAVRKAHKGLLRKGRAARGPEELHEARKAGKRLRYLLDAFAPVIGPGAVRGLVKDLKALQDVLGAMQDGAVHAELLTNAGARLAGAPAPTLIAIGRLVEAEHRRQDAAADAFADRFARFEAQRRRVKAALAALERA